MKDLHPYVPTQTTQSTQTIPGSDTDIEVVKDTFHSILFGGDQMTVARARGSQRIRKNSERAKDRLEGLTPVCEDWHAKLCFLGVSNSGVTATDSAICVCVHVNVPDCRSHYLEMAVCDPLHDVVTM